MAMEFTIKPLQAVLTLQEPLLVELTLTNDERDLAVPVELENVDVVTFYLLDKRGKVVAQGDGYSARTRQGLPAIRTKHSDLQTWTYEKGQPRRWQDDMLRYLDVPAPGDYAIKATFTLPDQKVALESTAVPITVQAGEVIYIDAWRDYIASIEGMFVQQVRVGSIVKTIVNEPGWESPLISRRSGTVTLQSATEPKFAEGDYAVVDAHEDERFRWSAWVAGKKLRLVSINDRAVVSGDPFAEGIAVAKPAVDIELPSEGVELVGRPVQHQNLSVSVYTAQPLKSGMEIRQQEFDRTGKLLSNSTLLSSDKKLMPANSAAMAERTYIVAATAGGAPLHLLRVENSKAQPYLLLEPAELQKLDASIRGEARFLYVAVDVKPYRIDRSAVVGVFVATTEAGKGMFIVNVPLNEDGVPQSARAAVQRVANPQLPRVDDLVPLQVIHDQRLQLHALFATAQGELWHVGISSKVNKVAEAGTPHARYARLYETGSGYLYALFATRDRGVAQFLLQKSNPFQ